MPLGYEQCLVSLAHKYSQDSTLHIIADILISRIDMFLDNFRSCNLSLSDIHRIQRGINMFEFKQKHNLSNQINEALQRIQRKCQAYMNENRISTTHIENTSSSSGKKEKLVVNYIEEFLGNRNDIRISTNTYKDGFELDILLICNEKHNHKMINIEVDGPSHDISNTKYFMKLRDELLRNKYDISIIRIPLRIYGTYLTT